jgi:hypothetical protein
MSKKSAKLGDHAITIDGRDLTVIVQKAADDGFEVIVPVRGKTETVYGPTVDAALAAARERLIAVASEPIDKVRAVFQRDVEVDGKPHTVHVTQYASGAVDLVADAWEDVRHSGPDEETALTFIAEMIVARLATTVDGVEARIDSSRPPQLPMHTVTQCAAEVHRCLEELGRRTARAEDAKRAQKHAETALAIAQGALLDAVDREAQPSLLDAAA